MYADDTAVLCGGHTLEVARRRAQRAADILVHWAQQNKMTVAGEKTQLLVLSQWARDSNCEIRVAGEVVRSGGQLKLLGVTLDRLLHFGPHCRALRQRTRPRLHQLKKLTGRSWGLGEKQLRTVASGYVRGALEHAAAAWLPAAAPAHVEVLERELRAAARTITCCPMSTPSHAVLAEAGLEPMSARRSSLAARFLAKARALPESDPLRVSAEASPPARLKGTQGWRTVGSEAWRAAGIESSVEQSLTRRPPPWERTEGVTFGLTVGALRPGAPPAEKRRVAEEHLAALLQCATWMWTDGSADGGVLNGAGVLVVRPEGEEAELRIPAGSLCSIFRAEMFVLDAALKHLSEHLEEDPGDPVVVCTDSRSALASLSVMGPAGDSWAPYNQTSTSCGATAWWRPWRPLQVPPEPHGYAVRTAVGLTTTTTTTDGCVSEVVASPRAGGRVSEMTASWRAGGRVSDKNYDYVCLTN